MSKNINGTGIIFAWDVRVVDVLPDSDPDDSSGPLQPGCPINLTNTLGNLIVYCTNDEFKVWVLKYGSDRHPAWVQAQAGDPHPDTDHLGGYGLSMRNPSKPSWVKWKTLELYRAPSKQQVSRVLG